MSKQSGFEAFFHRIFGTSRHHSFVNANTLNISGFYRNLEQVLDVAPGTLKGGEALAGLDTWDSMAVLGFLAMADEQYGAMIPPKRVPECRTVDDLTDLIREFGR
jgi:acyl carrier protein